MLQNEFIVFAVSMCKAGAQLHGSLLLDVVVDGRYGLHVQCHLGRRCRLRLKFVQLFPFWSEADILHEDVFAFLFAESRLLRKEFLPIVKQ